MYAEHNSEAVAVLTGFPQIPSSGLKEIPHDVQN